MPSYVRKALLARGVMTAYRSRPAYQRNDYLSWIKRAKIPATREKRLSQMLDELEQGGKYMNMDYRPRRPPR
jgi:uncharacterized protein YdeI (YjbR/CyaY-like superfamily)